nr:RNA-directed DNA polymerase, eukaryota, nucleotide-binding alpha-beta plait domain protein [Tanacetum cinerariifolium]
MTNFPDHITAHDLWKVCNDYEVIMDAFIPYKKSKAGHKPSAPSHPSNSNKRDSPGSYVSILKSHETNNVMSDQVLPSLILDDSCILDRDFILSLMVKVKNITGMPNLYVILEKEGFQNLSLTYLVGLWALIEMVSISAKEKLLNHTGVGLCESSDDEEDTKDDGSQSEDKVTTDNDVTRVSESSCMHTNDLFYDNNHNNIMPDKDKALSDDPFNLYDILNKIKDSGEDLKYLPSFTPSVINMEEVNKKVKGATSNSGGILCFWEPTWFVKDNVTSSDNFFVVMSTWVLSSSKLLIKSVFAPQDLTENRVL